MPPSAPSDGLTRGPAVAWRITGAVAGVALVWWLRPVWQAAAAPLFLTLLLVVALDPPTSWLAKRRLPGGRYTAAGLLLVALGLLIALAYWQLGALVIRQAGDLARNLSESFPDFWARVEPQLSRVLQSFGVLGSEGDYALVLDRFGTQFQGLLEGLWVALKGLAETLFVRPWRFIVVPFLTFHALGDLPRLRASARDLVPDRWRDDARWLAREVVDVLGKYLRGLVGVILLAMTVYALVFTMIGIENAVFLGMLAGLGEAIPFIGSVISFSIVALMTLVNEPAKVLAVALTYGLYSLFESQVVVPRVMGSHLKIHPVVVLLAILVMEPLLGLAGLVVAAPTAALVRSVWLHWRERRPDLWSKTP